MNKKKDTSKKTNGKKGQEVERPKPIKEKPKKPVKK